MQEFKYSYINKFRLNYRRIAWSLPKSPIFVWNGMLNPINKKLKTDFKFKKEFFDRMGRTLKI